MTLDLSALDDPTPAPDGGSPNGEPLSIALNDIEVDPNQPRKTFNPATMAELVESIKAHGVIQPVSVRPHPNKPGMWMLNFGERRYRASVEAGLSHIRAFVDHEYSEYAQVIENLHRDALKPMELALFIAKKKKGGDKNAEIARQLAMDPATITNHLALLDMPAAMERAYNEGRCTSPKILYDLRGLHKAFEEEVEAFLAGDEEITRTAVVALSARLKAPQKAPNSQNQDDDGAGSPPPETLEHSKVSPQGGGAGDGEDAERPKKQSGQVGAGEGSKASSQRSPDGDGGDGGDGDGDSDAAGKTSWPRGKVASDPTLMKKPLLMVRVDGRAAAVLLNRKPSTPGLIHVCYENGENAEVDAGACVIDSLTEET